MGEDKADPYPGVLECWPVEDVSKSENYYPVKYAEVNLSVLQSPVDGLWISAGLISSGSLLLYCATLILSHILAFELDSLTVKKHCSLYITAKVYFCFAIALYYLSIVNKTTIDKIYFDIRKFFSSLQRKLINL